MNKDRLPSVIELEDYEISHYDQNKFLSQERFISKEKAESYLKTIIRATLMLRDIEVSILVSYL